ncbi:MAG: DNA polymerase III subunit [Nitrospirota bacterium]|nr:DNA polymerase III subunit [Nitrospirota bacterium]
MTIAPPPSRAFDSLLGHPAPVRLLEAALTSGRLPHGLLFHGPVGVGKATAAGLLARAVLCAATTPADRPCGTCPVCGRLQRGTAYELIRLTPDGAQIKIEQVRALTERMRADVARGVVVIDPADAMNAATANALLKTLEEPPSGWTLILVTARPEALLPTVRSRCQAVRFAPLGVEATRAVLRAQGVPSDGLELLAAFADGAPGVVLGQGLNAADLTAEVSAVLRCLEAETLDSPARMVAAGEEWGKEAARTRRFLACCALWVSHALHAGAGAGPQAGLPGVEHSPGAWAARFPAGFLASFQLKLAQTTDLLDRNIARPTAVTGLLVALGAGRSGLRARTTNRAGG